MQKSNEKINVNESSGAVCFRAFFNLYEIAVDGISKILSRILNEKQLFGEADENRKVSMEMPLLNCYNVVNNLRQEMA